MDNLQHYSKQLTGRLFIALFVSGIIVSGSVYAADELLHLGSVIGLIAGLGVAALVAAVLALTLGKYFSRPTRLLAEAILHLDPETADQVAAPKTETAKLGKELVGNLVHRLYELVNAAHQASKQAGAPADLHDNFIASSLPLPLITLDTNQTILFINKPACEYLGLKESDAIGKNFYSLIDLAFPSEDTLDGWLTTAQNSNVTASRSWERVRLEVTEAHPVRLFDLAAYYNQANPQGIETMLVLFDHTGQYIQDDQAISFIALSVHELRTPLTLLRGYIEAFEDEFAGKLEPELNDFMFKMSASAQQLTAFVNNILNVARVDDDQLVLQLHEENWHDVISNAADNMALRAKVRGITLEYSVAPNLPTVGADKVSVLEVISNLVDNAIKYSGSAKQIRISTYLNADGLVETTVTDHGVGIPENILSHLFTKFYRDHHNRAQIGGTGLGLYLSKAIITAHGGSIWVKSKQGEGSTFGFTLIPYNQLADGQRAELGNEITRSAHGWIKNHSLYRR